MAAWQAERDRVSGLHRPGPRPSPGRPTPRCRPSPSSCSTGSTPCSSCPASGSSSPGACPVTSWAATPDSPSTWPEPATIRSAGTGRRPSPIDTGVVTVTDKRAVFSGSLHTRTWDYTTVIGYHANAEPPWTAIAVSDRQRVSGIALRPAHAEEFRFALALGLARGHGARPAWWMTCTVSSTSSTGNGPSPGRPSAHHRAAPVR
jgi:hypothetical protein